MKTYYAIEPASFKLDGGAMFGIIPKPLWHKVHPADELNRIDLALRLLLIKSGDKTILIDTGIGDYHGDKFDQRFAVTNSHSPLENALLKIGLKTSDITDLIISHLHFDHVGGIAKMENNQLVPLFQNATLYLHKEHFDYAEHPTIRDAGSFHHNDYRSIIKWYESLNKIQWLSGMEGNLIDSADLKFKCSMGHTPFLLHAYDDKFIYMADLIPTSNHVSIPWVMGYDISPGITTTDKSHFLNFIHQKSLTMIFEHDPIYYGSTVKKDEYGEYRCDEKKPFEKDSGAYAIF